MRIKIKKHSGEIFVAFMDKIYNNAKIGCYSCYDDTHFETDINYINHSRNIKDEKTINKVLKALANRGYDNIEIIN